MKLFLVSAAAAAVLFACWFPQGAFAAKKEDEEKIAGENEVPGWGEPGYWLYLEDIKIEGAVFEPEFNPIYGGPYEAVIPNAALTMSRITPQVDIKKYSPRYPPDLHFNDEKLTWSPVRAVHLPVQLNKTHGAFDESYTLSVCDPWGG